MLVSMVKWDDGRSETAREHIAYSPKHREFWAGPLLEEGTATPVARLTRYTRLGDTLRNENQHVLIR